MKNEAIPAWLWRLPSLQTLHVLEVDSCVCACAGCQLHAGRPADPCTVSFPPHPAQRCQARWVLIAFPGATAIFSKSTLHSLAVPKVTGVWMHLSCGLPCHVAPIIIILLPQMRTRVRAGILPLNIIFLARLSSPCWRRQLHALG